MIQDIEPHHLYNEYRPGQRLSPQSIVIHFAGDQLLLRQGEDGQYAFPRLSDFPEGALETAEPGAAADADALVYLFSVDRQDFFLFPGEALPALPQGAARLSLRSLRRSTGLGRTAIYSAWTAWQLCRWYRDNVFCGRCGTRTTLKDNERALVCPHCGRVIYPRIIPAVIVGVIHGDEILMTKYAGRDIPFFALIAGFTEIGETLEQTVEREVMEEVGLRVKNIRYYKSQPWGIVDDLLSGFYCDLDGSPEISLDRNELKQAVWVRREDVTGQPDDFSLTNEMMMTFKAGKEPR